jgi:hypothetical protein
LEFPATPDRILPILIEGYWSSRPDQTVFYQYEYRDVGLSSRLDQTVFYQY